MSGERSAGEAVAGSASGRPAGDGVPRDGRFVMDVPVRFRDLDPMGHAHHTLPLIYLEEARAAFWRELSGSATLEGIDYVMAEVTVRFHSRIRYPSTVAVRLGVQAIGTSSFTMDFEIRDAEGTLLSSGSTVQVAYDYAAARSKPLDPPTRAALEAWRSVRQEKSIAMVAETMPISAPST